MLPWAIFSMIKYFSVGVSPGRHSRRTLSTCPSEGHTKKAARNNRLHVGQIFIPCPAASSLSVSRRLLAMNSPDQSVPLKFGFINSCTVRAGIQPKIWESHLEATAEILLEWNERKIGDF